MVWLAGKERGGAFVGKTNKNEQVNFLFFFAI